MARRLLRKSIPGIIDVARLAGVSPATVSRYSNQPDVVRYETRKRIESAIEELGYVPNGAARSLNMGASGTIGLIVPTIDNAIFAELAQAFSTALFRHSRTMLIAAHGYDLTRESVLVESLIEHRVDALAVVGLKHEEPTFEILSKRDIPAVMLWNYRERQPFPCIGVDNREVGRVATEHLIELGHRDILFLFAGMRGNDRAVDRRSGALSAMAAAGIDVPRARRAISPYDVQAAKELAVKALTATPRPTAIFSGNDVIALGVLFAAMSLGIRIPDDLSVIGIGDFRGSSAVEPGLTTVRIPARRIGRRGAEILIEMLDWPVAETRHDERLPVEVLLRGSTAQI
ncbi:MAG: LacI family DNA-binding transcriptional regulator [Alphaproteobacteria bacterium]|nr:LacI family DNA-binding transcriptional regulator [Alphaproteobacteria bacterium]